MEQHINIYKTDKEKDIINECYNYFINQFKSICFIFQKNEEILSCSPEGHVSKILSNRLSSTQMELSVKRRMYKGY